MVQRYHHFGIFNIEFNEENCHNSVQSFPLIYYYYNIYTTKSQEAFEVNRLSRIVVILVLRSVIGQSCYRTYCYPYPLVLLKNHAKTFE